VRGIFFCYCASKRRIRHAIRPRHLDHNRSALLLIPKQQQGREIHEVIEVTELLFLIYISDDDLFFKDLIGGKRRFIAGLVFFLLTDADDWSWALFRVHMAHL